MAASQDPMRFHSLLAVLGERANMVDFLACICGGIVDFLMYRSPSVQPPSEWSQVGEVEPEHIAGILLDESANSNRWDPWSGKLVRYSACHVRDAFRIEQVIGRLPPLDVKLLTDCSKTDYHSLIVHGSQSPLGEGVEGALDLLGNCLESEQAVPQSLWTYLVAAAQLSYPPLQALIVNSLPATLAKLPDLGWELLNQCLSSHVSGVGRLAERSLYYQYKANPEKVRAALNLYLLPGFDDCGDCWGRVACLMYLEGELSWEEIISSLDVAGNPLRWNGAVSVFASNLASEAYTSKCLPALGVLLSRPPHGLNLMALDRELFDQRNWPYLNYRSASQFLCCAGHGEDYLHHYFGWLEYFSARNPREALNLLEACQEFKMSVHNDAAKIVRVFVSAQREADATYDRAFCKKVIDLQDRYLVLNPREFEKLYESVL
jgi:hypothetical protein